MFSNLPSPPIPITPLPRKSCRLWDKMDAYSTVRQATQDIWHILVLLFLCVLLLTVVGLLCTMLLSCVCIFVTSRILFNYVCIALLHTLVAGLLARSQYSEGPATGHLDTGFSRFPCVYKQMLRWFPRFQVATACFSCSPPALNLLEPYFIFMYMHNNYCHRVTAHLQLNILLLLLLLLLLSSSSSSSSSCPLCRVSILTFLTQTMSLENTVLQLFCCYYSWCLYRQFQCWIYCTFTLVLSEICLQCLIWLFSVVPWLHVFLVCCARIFWITLK